MRDPADDALNRREIGTGFVAAGSAGLSGDPSAQPAASGLFAAPLISLLRIGKVGIGLQVVETSRTCSRSPAAGSPPRATCARRAHLGSQAIVAADHPAPAVYIEDYRLVKRLRDGLPTDMSVYDAASLSAVVELSMQSTTRRARAVDVRDFTRGRLFTNPKLDIVRV